MSILQHNTPDRNLDDYSAITYNPATHQFDVSCFGQVVASEWCYGDAEASRLIYLALREAEEAQADAAYRRARMAGYLLDTYPQAVYLNWREVFLMDPPRPILAPQIIVTRPNGYTVHLELNGGLGAVLEVLTFEVQS